MNQSIERKDIQNAFDVNNRSVDSSTSGGSSSGGGGSVIADKESKITLCTVDAKDKKFFMNEFKKAQKEFYIEHQDQLKAEGIPSFLPSFLPPFLILILILLLLLLLLLLLVLILILNSYY